MLEKSGYRVNGILKEYELVGSRELVGSTALVGSRELVEKERNLRLKYLSI